jgi:imidazolonepropionase-like amidohydrolase
LKQQQQQWDCLNSQRATNAPRPYDIDLEPLVALLNGEINLNVHCYTVQDMEMVIRTAAEFNITINAFHHALEAWKMPEIIAANGITTAIFADYWGFKMEGYDGTVYAPLILWENGVNVVLKSDHPVLFGGWLMYEAAKANFYGLPDWYSLAAITRNPALSMGLYDRVGRIAVGLDGDVVLWDRPPLEVAAQPYQVLIEGELAADNSAFASAIVPPTPDGTATLEYVGPTACTQSQSASYAVTGVTIYTMDASNTVHTGATIVVTDGIISCIGPPAVCPVPNGADDYILDGGQIIPGMINVGTSVGLYEVDSEDNSADGFINPSSTGVRAIDGIRWNMYQRRHLTAAWAGGVTTLVTQPWGPGLILGTGVAYYTAPGVATIDDALVSPDSDSISLHLSIGNPTKNGGGIASISGQISTLRAAFTAAQGTVNSSNPLSLALQGLIPVVVNAQQADDIASAVRLQKQFGFNMIILGGAEAVTVAGLLAQNNVSVILSPPRIPPMSTFSTWNAVRKTASLLYASGVNVGIAVANADQVRDLRWEAGIQQADETIPAFDKIQAIASITKNIAQFFRLKEGTGTITIGSRANFVAFTGEPLTFASDIALVAVGQTVTCNPTQYGLFFGIDSKNKNHH